MVIISLGVEIKVEAHGLERCHNYGHSKYLCRGLMLKLTYWKAAKTMVIISICVEIKVKAHVLESCHNYGHYKSWCRDKD